MEVNPTIRNDRATDDNFVANLYFTEHDFEQNIDDIDRRIRNHDGVSDLLEIDPSQLNESPLIGREFFIKHVDKKRDFHLRWIKLDLKNKAGYFVVLVRRKPFIFKITTEKPQPQSERVRLVIEYSGASTSQAGWSVGRDDDNSESVELKLPPSSPRVRKAEQERNA